MSRKVEGLWLTSPLCILQREFLAPLLRVPQLVVDGFREGGGDGGQQNRDDPEGLQNLRQDQSPLRLLLVRAL